MFRLTGVAILILLLTRIDLAQVLGILAHLSAISLVPIALLTVAIVAVKAWRWRHLMDVLGIHYSLNQSVLMYAAGLFLGAVTPGQVGDFGKALFLTGDGHPPGRAFFSVVWDRLLDVASLLCLACISALFFVHLLTGYLVALLSFLAVVLTAVGVFVLHRDTLLPCVRSWVNRITGAVFSRMATRWDAKATLAEWFGALRLVNTSTHIALLTTTVVGWGMYFTLMYLLSQLLEINISFLAVVACVSISLAVSLLPISIAGLGTRDITLVALFSTLGLSSEAAIAFSTLLLLLYFVNSLICFPAWLVHPLRMRTHTGGSSTQS